MTTEVVKMLWRVLQFWSVGWFLADIVRFATRTPGCWQ